MKGLRRVLAVAREDDQQLPKEIELRGPMSTVFSKALDVAYAKEKAEPELATESQAQEVTLFSQLADQITDDYGYEDNIVIYAVTEDEINDQTVRDVAADLTNASEPQNYIVAIDATNGSGTEKVMAIECLVKSFGGKLYRL